MERVYLSLLGLGFLFLAGQSSADVPPASHYLWRNTNYNSHYLLYDFPTKTYVETVDCRPLWRFNVVSNALNTLTLHDASRGMTVMVNYEGMYLKAKGETQFKFYQKGTFDTRWQFSHNNPNGVYSGAITKKHGCETVEYLAGATSATWKFKEIGRNNDYVDLYDASRNMLVRLYKDSMHLRTGNNPLAFFKRGSWNK